MKTKPWERKNFYANPEVQLVKRARRTPEQVEIDDLREELANLLRNDPCNGSWASTTTTCIFNGVQFAIPSYVWLDADERNTLIAEIMARLTSLKEARALREATRGKSNAIPSRKGGRL